MPSVCRLCMNENNEKDVMINIFDTFNQLCEQIFFCVTLEISETDDLPKTVCVGCSEKVKEFVAFKEMCLKSNEVIHNKNTFSGNIKKEFPNDACMFNLSDINLKNEESGNSSDTDYSEKCDRNHVRLRKQKTIQFRKKIENITDKDDRIVSLEKDIECLKIQQYTCEICSVEYDSILEYFEHQEVHRGQPVFKCDRCSEIYSSKEELKDHEKFHKVSCPECGKYVLPCSLRAHLKFHTDHYKCTICSSRQSNKTMLATHMLISHTEIKNFVCESCGKRFNTKSKLVSHCKMHSDLREYHCKMCAYSAKTSSSLYIHMAKHENSALACQTCAKTFKSRRSLKDHTRRVHTASKKHECNYCDKKFVDKYMLTVHLRTHTGSRPYQCSLCERTFVRSDGLKEHMATHGERYIYVCKKCGKHFIYRRSLSRHTCTDNT